MKEFIVLVCIISILFFFPLQFVVEQVNHYRISTLQNIVNNSAQKARTDGYFTNTNIKDTKDKIVRAFPKVDESEIEINVTTTPKYRLDEFDRREMINYEIYVPIDKILAMHKFFNISNEDNKFKYKISGSVASEVLMP